MGVWLRRAWSTARDSLWFVPAVFTAVAMALAAALMTGEARGLLWSGEAPRWVYQGDAEAARAVLSAVGGSLITVTGVVFSVTIVAVQLASSQYTPRVLRNFSSDRGNQVVLGVFIGTFSYTTLVLRTVGGARGDAEFVPRLAVTVGMVLLLVCVAALIYFFDHVAQGIRVTTIMARITRETVANVHQLFPEHIGRADEAPPPDPRRPEHDSVAVLAHKAGYIQMVDQDHLFALGSRERLVIGMEPKIGDFVLPGRPLASVWAAGPVDEALAREIRRAFVLGPERMPDQDVEFGIVQISDIAIKALSPSVNDPTTALRGIDRLAEILAEFGTRNPPEPRRTRNGDVHFVATYTTFEVAVKVAFDDIRHFGAPIPLVAERLVEVIADLVLLVPPGRREPLLDQGRAVLHAARASIRNPRDRADLERAARLLSERSGCDFGPGQDEGSGDSRG